jgi:hypothetical protein
MSNNALVTKLLNEETFSVTCECGVRFNIYGKDVGKIHKCPACYDGHKVKSCEICGSKFIADNNPSKYLCDKPGCKIESTKQRREIRHKNRFKRKLKNW